MVDVFEGSLGVSDGDGLPERRGLHDQGSRTHYILFFINIASRSVHVAGITPHPDDSWMTQIARNSTAVDDGFLRGKRYLILDRDAKYSDAFRSALAREVVQVIRLPPRSPN